MKYAYRDGVAIVEGANRKLTTFSLNPAIKSLSWEPRELNADCCILSAVIGKC